MSEAAKQIHKMALDFEQKQRIKEMVEQGELSSIIEFAKEEYNKVTGQEIDFHEVKGQNKKVPFAQIITPNIAFLGSIKYLDPNEESLVLRLSHYCEFKSNCLIEKPKSKNSKTRKEKKETEEKDFSNGDLIPKSATVSYLAKDLKISRTKVSLLMNELKKKGILSTAETGIVTENGRVCTSRTWFMNPNIIYCGKKDQIDLATQRIFKDSLVNFKDEDGKKVKLPIRLFL